MTHDTLRLDLFVSSEQSPAGTQLMQRTARKASIGIWTAFTGLLAILWLTGDGHPAYGAWIAICLATPHALHRVSSRSSEPVPAMQQELFVAALIQGAMLPFLEFRFLPSLVVLTPLTGFVLLGGLRLLLLGGLVLGLACWTTATLLGTTPQVTSSAITQVYCAVVILANQFGLALVALRSKDQLLALRPRAPAHQESDQETGLRTRGYLAHVMAAAQPKLESGEGQSAGDSAIDLDRRLLFTVVHVDRLLTIRHQYGRPGGERVLREMAHRLVQRIQDPDLVVRWDDDEFLVLHHIDDATDATTALDRLQRTIRSRPFEADATHSLRVTVSLGSALLPRVPATAERLPWRHVVALAHYAASQARRIGDRWLLVSEDLDEGSREFKTARGLDELVAAGVLIIEDHDPDQDRDPVRDR